MYIENLGVDQKQCPPFCQRFLGGGVPLFVIRPKMYEYARTSSNRRKSSEGQISPHTQQTTPFPSGCSLLTRIQDDWCRTIEASPIPRAWLGEGWIGSLSAAGWSATSGCDFGSFFFFDELRFSRSTLYGRPSNDQDQPGSSSQWFAYPYFCPW